jgi:hypothetical protein
VFLVILEPTVVRVMVFVIVGTGLGLLVILNNIFIFLIIEML